MEVEILYSIKEALCVRGTLVLLDVFGDLAVQPYLFGRGVEKILLIDDAQEAVQYKMQNPEVLLIGDRDGEIFKNFDFPSSPLAIEELDFTEKTAVHTSSDLLQEIVNSAVASEILVGSFTNAKAVAAYILNKKTDSVFIACLPPCREKVSADDLCARYIRGLILNNPMRIMAERIRKLKLDDGAKFFSPQNQTRFPEKNFYLSTDLDRFSFVIRLEKGQEGIPFGVKVDAEYHSLTPSFTKVSSGDMLSSFEKQEVILFPREVKKNLCYGNYIEPEGDFDAAFVLGGITYELPYRAQAAAKLYHEGRCSFFILTGGVSWETEFGFVTESEALFRYMVAEGVPENCLVMENKATSTRENMTLSREILAKRIKIEGARIAIVTSYSHVRRSVLLTRYYIPEAEHFGVRANLPLDNPQEFQNSEDLCAAVITECRCIWENVKKGIFEDICVME